MSVAASDDNPLRVVKSLRVSTDEQVDGSGLDAQRSIIDRILDDIDEDIEIVDEFVEKGVSGTEFPRTKLLKIFDLARRDEIDCLVVKDISRIGRVSGPTFGFIWVLNVKFNVDLITEDGRFNVLQKSDLINVFFSTLNAEMKNRFRTSYVIESQIESFQQGHFHVAGRKCSFGYQKTIRDKSEIDDEEILDKLDEIETDRDEEIQAHEDLEVHPEQKPVAKRIFEIAKGMGPKRDIFARVREQLTEEFDEDRIPDENIDLNTLLRDPIYKGRPTWKVNLSTDETKSATMNREDLAIIDESLFEEVQNMLDARYTKHYNNRKSDSDSSPDQVTTKQLTSMVGLSRLVVFDDVVKIHCPECGEVMQDNGEWRATCKIKPTNVADFPDEPLLQRYKCPNDDCERSEKRFPNEFEGYMLLNPDISLDELSNIG